MAKNICIKQRHVIKCLNIRIKEKDECLTTPQLKNKSAIGCQTNSIEIKSKKSNIYINKVHTVINCLKSCAKFITNT